ncbi:MAG: hypothetical protein GY714_00660 [Desulfobacterales bacterium]|nr:hypothetical protein [Desulfobacterales bacterium]
MTEKKEIEIAFAIWELMAQLDALLWDRYFDAFNEIMYDLEKNRGMEKHFPFHPIKTEKDDEWPF